MALGMQYEISENMSLWFRIVCGGVAVIVLFLDLLIFLGLWALKVGMGVKGKTRKFWEYKLYKSHGDNHKLICSRWL